MWFQRLDSILARSRRLPAAALVAAALRDRLQQPADTLDAPLRHSLSAWCDDARGRGARPEALILELKRIWRDVLALRPPAEAGRRQELRAHGVTFCIEQYYRKS